MNPQENKKIIDEIFSKQSEALDIKSDGKYKSLALKFNPFPRSGTTNINSSDLYNQQLIPVDQSVREEVIDFISHSLIDNYIDPEDKFISATITGDYGSGKTQLLMFVKYLLGEVSAMQKGSKNPYVIYIDNPGVKLLELIGAIISKIGEENFKKFIWTKIIYKIKSEPSLRAQLAKYENKSGYLFKDVDPDPYSEKNTISYKKFLNAFIQNTPRQRKEFETSFKEVLLKVLEDEAGNTILAQYFYQLISEDYGVNKTWEALSSGSIKQLDHKEAEIIKYIVKLIKEQGYTDFFILVDEFEDITQGRLTKTQVDNYIYNLRTLLDEHRSWCLLFAMTGQALKKLRGVSPPLADRITSRLIILQDLNTEQAMQITLNHLNIARDENLDDLIPFDFSGIKKLNELVEGNARKFLKNCYFLVEKASETFQEADKINAEFVSTNITKDIL
jgi:Cdc6-like AAA superfamily ATPase